MGFLYPYFLGYYLSCSLAARKQSIRKVTLKDVNKFDGYQTITKVLGTVQHASFTCAVQGILLNKMTSSDGNVFRVTGP